MNRKLEELKEKYNISDNYIEQYQYLSGYKIIFVFDDSATMNDIVIDSRLKKGFSNARRWDELQDYAKCAIDLANLNNKDGIDCYFLNRGNFKEVKNFDGIKSEFDDSKPPKGHSPILDKFKEIIKDNETYFKGQDGKLLITLVVDGKSTDKNGKDNTDKLKSEISNLDKNIRVRIVSITDDHKFMEFLDGWESHFNNRSEDKGGMFGFGKKSNNNNKSEDRIVKFWFTDHFNVEQRNTIDRFSFGDYVVKSLIGQLAIQPLSKSSSLYGVTQPLSKSPSGSSVIKKV